MKKTKPQPPEGLNYLTALSSMKAIRKIFKDQAEWYSNILWIRVEAPFRLIDFHSFEKSLSVAGTTDHVIIKKLKEIIEWASGNIKLFEEIELRNLEGTDKRHYHIEANGDIFTVNTEKGISEFGQKFKIQLYTMCELKIFCEQVNNYVTDLLEAYRTKSLNTLIKQPKDTTGPTAAQVALFIKYLNAGKYITYPQRSDFVKGDFLKKPPINYSGSPMKLYQLFTKRDTLTTEKNFRVVISMLKNYPAALKMAKNDQYGFLQDLANKTS